MGQLHLLSSYSSALILLPINLQVQASFGGCGASYKVAPAIKLQGCAGNIWPVKKKGLAKASP